MLTVLLVMVALARGRQWREAAIAAGVLVVLGLSVILRHH